MKNRNDIGIPVYPDSDEMVNLMLDNLLLEAGIITNLTQDCSKGSTGIERVQKAIESCMYTPERNQPSNLFHVVNNVTCMDTQDATNLAIKLEPDGGDFEIQNVPLAINNIGDNQPETPLPQLDYFKMISNVLHDHAYCAVFNIPYYREVESNIEYFRTEKRNLLEIKTSQALNESIKPIYEDWKIKNEELDIKEEDLDHKQTSIFPVHMLLHKNPEERKILKCYYVCSYQTFCKYDLKSHVLQHRPEREKFKCDVCEYETFLKSIYNTHMLRHRNPKKREKYQCYVCKHQTFYKHHLITHVLQHRSSEEREKYKCDVCQFKTLHKRYLTTHMLRHMNPEERKKFQCDLCEYQTFQKRNLNRHMLRHMNLEERQKFKCDVCEYQTFYKQRFKKHMLRHKKSVNPEKFNAINVSEYQALYQSTLKAQMLNHKNPEEREKYKCEVCQYQTHHKSNLKTHILWHENPEKYMYIKHFVKGM